MTKYIAIEPNIEMHDRIRAKAEKVGFSEEAGSLHILSFGAQDLDEIATYLSDHSISPQGGIDTVISSMTFCSIPQAEVVIPALLHQLLRPHGGMLLFYEHVLSDREDIAYWQRFWTPVMREIADGCNLDRASLIWIDGMGGWSEKEVWFQEDDPVESLNPHLVGKYVKA